MIPIVPEDGGTALAVQVAALLQFPEDAVVQPAATAYEKLLPVTFWPVAFLIFRL